MLLMKYECEYIEIGMIGIVQEFYLFEVNNSSYLTVTADDILNLQINKTYNLQCINSKIMMSIIIIID